jgi:hypothetical protein
MCVTQLPETLFDFPEHSISKTIGYTTSGYYGLLDHIDIQVQIIEQIVKGNHEYFAPFVRGGSRENIYEILESIQDDLKALSAMKVPFCKYDSECKRKECCAYIHSLDLDQIIRPLHYLEQSKKRFLTGSMSYSLASIIIRNLYFLQTGMWTTLCRRRFGRKIILKQEIAY